jgi:hypothetical protein
MTDTLEKQKLLDRIKELETAIAYYEGDGVAKLFYGLNRKAAEMADLLNSTNLKSLDLTDPKDKTFERLKVIWNDASSIAAAVKGLSESAGISGNDTDETSKPVYRRVTTPESIADGVGELAGKKN